jgi:glycosyltransferase involved in cell wall biosynthesis
MRIGLDATPLLGARTGVGRYVAELVRHLPTAVPCGDELVATAFTVRGAADLEGDLPPGVFARHRRFPARLLQQLWSRAQLPTVGAFVGPVDVFHGTNFVLPPPGRAAGVVTVHDLAFLRLPEVVSAASRRYRELVPRSLARAAAVCTPSRSVAEDLADAYRLTGLEVVVTPLGVGAGWEPRPPPDRAWLAALGLTGDYLLFTGNVEPRKGLPTVVAALRLLRERGHRDLPQLCLAGPAGWGPSLDVSGLPDGLVVRVGHVSDDTLVGLVAGARAVLYPSRYEGFGLPVLEAFSQGTAVIATEIPTTVELLDDEHGLAALFPVGDVEALAELVELSGATETGEVGARRRALAARYSWSRTAQLTADVYRRVGTA